MRKALIAIGVVALIAGGVILSVRLMHHQQKPENIEIAVNYVGTILWNGKPVTCQEVNASLAGMSPEMRAVVRTHPLDCGSLRKDPQPYVKLNQGRRMASRMTGVGFRYAVCSLRAKRAEIAGEIDTLRLQLAHRRRDLAKVDDILRILSPASDPALIPPKKAIKYLNVFRQGELGRLIIGLLRTADGPMTNLEIARTVMERGGLSQDLWVAIHRRTRANLAYLEAQGRVFKSGAGRMAVWALTGPKGVS